MTMPMSNQEYASRQTDSAHVESAAVRRSIQRVYLVRHGETKWSLSGQHTGRTDIPLTASGEEAARRLAPAIGAERFALVLTSPLERARRTCELAGAGARAEIDPDLIEWQYRRLRGPDA